MCTQMLSISRWPPYCTVQKGDNNCLLTVLSSRNTIIASLLYCTAGTQ